MGLLVHDCPRCGSAKTTFDVMAQQWRAASYNWMNHYEIFVVCRNCRASAIFEVSDDGPNSAKMFREAEDGLVTYEGGLNRFFRVDGFINIADVATRKAPEHISPLGSRKPSRKAPRA